MPAALRSIPTGGFWFASPGVGLRLRGAHDDQPLERDAGGLRSRCEQPALRIDVRTDVVAMDGVEMVDSLEEALRVADVVSLHVDLNASTAHLLDWLKRAGGDPTSNAGIWHRYKPQYEAQQAGLAPSRAANQ